MRQYLNGKEYEEGEILRNKTTGSVRKYVSEHHFHSICIFLFLIYLPMYSFSLCHIYVSFSIF